MFILCKFIEHRVLVFQNRTASQFELPPPSRFTIRYTRAPFPYLDLLLANAKISHPAKLVEFTRENLRAV
jgi:hypothetical protein